jgi:hypothetical protein
MPALFSERISVSFSSTPIWTYDTTHQRNRTLSIVVNDSGNLNKHRRDYSNDAINRTLSFSLR